MASVAVIKREFLQSLGSCRSLFSYSLSTRGLHTEAGVEASFLQLFRAWEAFLEDLVVVLLIGRLRCDGRSVPAFFVVNGEKIARGILEQERSYSDWAEEDKVIKRLDALFVSPCLLTSAMVSIRQDLFAMRVIRNAIAHSSRQTSDKLQRVAQQYFGGRPAVMRACDLLVMTHPSNVAFTMFDFFAQTLELGAIAMTG